MLWSAAIRSARASTNFIAASVSRNCGALGYMINHGSSGGVNIPNPAAQVLHNNNINNVCCHRFVHIERRLTELGIALPPAPTPRANYNIACHASGNMLYISGHLPFTADGTLYTGRVGPADSTQALPGEELRSLEYGYQAARLAGLNLISTIQSQLEGDLDRVEQVVKLFGIVNSTTDFKQQHLVMDGCSDVIMEVFGPKVGYHARSAIGTNTLPLDITVEVEAIVQIKPKS